MTFYTRTPEGYVETTDRPTSIVYQALLGEGDTIKETASLHRAGMGWHYVHGEPAMCFNGSYWFLDWPTSEGAILKALKDCLSLFGVDIKPLYEQAYPDQKYQPPTTEDHCNVANTTKHDLPALLDDLTDINYHSLRQVIEETLNL